MLFVKPCSAACCPIYSNMPEYAKPEDLAAAGIADPHKHNPNGWDDMNQVDNATGGDPAVMADKAAYQALLDREKEGGHNIDLNELFIH